MNPRLPVPEPLVACCLLLLVLVAAPAVAADVRVLADTPSQSVDGPIHYFVDGDESITIDALLDGEVAPDWQRLDESPNFGYTQATHWYRITLENATAQRLERFFEISYPLLDHIEFYRVRDGQVRDYVRTGDNYSHETRPIQNRVFAFPMSLAPEERNTLYLRIRTSGSHQVPMTVWQPEAFHQASERDMVGRSLFYGMLLAVIIFNLFLFSLLRERAYVYYVVTNASLLWVMASLHGTAFQYLYPTMPDVHERITLVASGLVIFFLYLFSSNFLNVKQTLPRVYPWFRGLGVITLANTLAAFFLSYAVSTRVSVALAFGMTLAILAIGSVLVWRGNRSARYFMAAWVALLLGTVVWGLTLIGVTPSTFWSQYAIEAGAVAQAMLLSFALGDRFNREREARIGEQRERLRAMEQRERVERELLEQAKHHPLTELPNRTYLEEALESEIERIRGLDGGRLSLVLIHFRGFDDINKTLGHENADRVLSQLASRMNDVVLALPRRLVIEARDSHQFAAAHVEGITFACAFQPDSPQDMVEQMSKLVDALRQPVEFQGLNLDIRMVGGCSFYPDDSDDVATLLRHAFIAFDQADTDVSHVAVYTEEINPYSERRLTLMTELRRAIHENSLRLHLQPQVNAARGEVCGFEVLLRWTHPEYGFIPPDEFIPMAEQTGLIRPLTRWVVDQALTCCRIMKDRGHDLRVSVNISARNLQEPDFAEGINNLLERHGLEADRLILEVTETATMIDPKSALKALRTLYDAGIRLSIDDFGTGYSSLSYIRKLPVHEIKIDRSFVMEMDQNADDATIVRTTINMCHDLGFEVVAEGVETGATCDLLRNMSCDIMQGYYLARPMPEDEVGDWLKQYNDHQSGQSKA